MSKLYVNEIAPKTTGTDIISPFSTSNVIETFTLLCDGSSITVPSGTYTSENVTSSQAVSTTYTDITGSTISYTPPSDAKYVIYRFNFTTGWQNTAHSIQHFKFFIDGTEVVYARHNRGAQYYEDRGTFEWAIGIGGTANTNTGRQASWTSAKTLKMQTRDYGANTNNQNMHVTQYWDGGGTGVFSMPTITITAIK